MDNIPPDPPPVESSTPPSDIPPDPFTRPAVLNYLWFVIAMFIIMMVAGIWSGFFPYPPVTPTPPGASPTASQATVAEEETHALTARVVNVVDGDTIDVELKGRVYRVRYIGIDAPERGEPLYEEATQANADLVAGRSVSLEADVREEDRFGRLLRYVHVGEIMVNEELVRRGLATAIMVPPDVAHAEEFSALEEMAREAGFGIWGDEASLVPVPQAATVPPAVPTIEPTSSPPAPTIEATREPSAPATRLTTPTIRLVAATPVLTTAGAIEIRTIVFDGAVPVLESDEYAEIVNASDAPVELQGWVLNAGNPGQDFIFPAHLLAPGESCRVYTNEVHPESCGFSFGREQAIWSNRGDCGYLYDAHREVVSSYCY